jgi:hypothetical protein
MCTIIPAAWEEEVGGSWSEASWDKISTRLTFEKQTRSKRAGGCESSGRALAEEH